MLDVSTEMKIDMTPMIDAVFNLIIFFMVVVKMTNDELEPLELPKAEQAEEAKSEDRERLVINLAKGPLVAGKTQYQVIINGANVTPEKRDRKWVVNGSRFQRILKDEAKLGNRQFSERQVLIRADEYCPYEYVAMVMAALVDPQIRIFKIQLGAEKVKVGEGER
ncbi:MAG: biopolymer transporter ExbD [Planctomycetes bacterium]|nr:biopolymer transporter ExbD [Planctomycetota bacterium]